MLVKVCGLTKEMQVQELVTLGVDLVGFIFYEPSPRYIKPEEVQAIKGTGVLGKKVGVIVDKSVEETFELASKAELSFLQLHGNQSVDFCKQLSSFSLFKVFWPEKYSDWKLLKRDLDLFLPWVKYFLFDAGKDLGGHGRSIQRGEWVELLKDYPIILAGGIGEHNLEEILKLNPLGIDLNSLVEKKPGDKDLAKIKRIIQKIKESIC